MTNTQTPELATTIEQLRRLVDQLDGLHEVATDDDGLTVEVWGHLSALGVLTMIEQTAREAVEHSATAARRGGRTWREIGRHVGTSAQAAQQRFGTTGR